jgi:hypothetical protein
MPKDLTYTLVCLENHRATIDDAWSYVLLGAILDLCESDYRVYDDEQYYRLRFYGTHSMELGGDLVLTFDIKLDERAQDFSHYNQPQLDDAGSTGRRANDATASVDSAADPACGAQSKQPCVFPFVYDGNTYEECVQLGQDVQAWCALSVDANGTCTDGCADYGINWDFCTECVESDAVNSGTDNNGWSGNNGAGVPLHVVPLAESSAFVAEFQRQDPPIFVEGGVPSSEARVSLVRCSASHRATVSANFQALQDAQCVGTMFQSYDCQATVCAPAFCDFFRTLQEALTGGCDAPEVCNIYVSDDTGDRTIDVCSPFLAAEGFWNDCRANLTFAEKCMSPPVLNLPMDLTDLATHWSTRYAVSMQANLFHLQGRMTFVGATTTFDGTITTLNGVKLGDFALEGASSSASSVPASSWASFSRARHVRHVGDAKFALEKTWVSSERACQQHCELSKACEGYTYRYLNMTDMMSICTTVTGNAFACVSSQAAYEANNCWVFLERDESFSPTVAPTQAPTAYPTIAGRARTQTPTGVPTLTPSFEPTSYPSSSYVAVCGCEEIGVAFCDHADGETDSTISGGNNREDGSATLAGSAAMGDGLATYACKECEEFEFVSECKLAGLSFEAEHDCRKWCFSQEFSRPSPPSQPQSCDVPSLFFSQFQEARSGNNRYYQIYNPLPRPVYLGEYYSIAFCVNGCDPDTEELFKSGHGFRDAAIIPAHGTYTICNSQLEGDLTVRTACEIQNLKMYLKKVNTEFLNPGKCILGLR